MPYKYLRELTRTDLKVGEEYFWAITQATGQSHGGRSGSSVLEFGFKFTYKQMYI